MEPKERLIGQGDLLAQATEKSTCKEKDGGRVHKSRVLSHQRIIEGGTASNSLDMFVVRFMSLDLLIIISMAREYETGCMIQKGLRPHSSRPSSWLKMVSSTT
jgi:hypothetical protein